MQKGEIIIYIYFSQFAAFVLLYTFTQYLAHVVVGSWVVYGIRNSRSVQEVIFCCESLMTRGMEGKVICGHYLLTTYSFVLHE